MTTTRNGGGSWLYAKAVTVHPPPESDDPPFLLTTLAIDCTVCGQTTVLLAGHHLRAVVRALQKVIDTAAPELTVEGAVEVVERRFDRNFRAENN